MKHTPKIILLSAIGTTLFWLGVIAVLIVCCGRTTRSSVAFWDESDDFGVVTIGGSPTQSMVAIIEDLGSVYTNLAAIGPPLIRHELRPGEYLRLGIRTTNTP